MERRTRDGTAAATTRPMTPQEFEDFFKEEYPKLVKVLRVRGATFEEAEEAAQAAMEYFHRKGRLVARIPAAYVLTAAFRFFVKERERERLTCELPARHPTSEGCHDDGLITLEQTEEVERLLGGLTPAQRKVFKLVMDGMTTREIAEQLGKTHPNIRQLLKQGRDRLKQSPDLATVAPTAAQDSCAERKQRSTAATPEPRKEEVQ
jgi:RNA polymerase sigma factor (sigma-70 family)